LSGWSLHSGWGGAAGSSSELPVDAEAAATERPRGTRGAHGAANRKAYKQRRKKQRRERARSPLNEDEAAADAELVPRDRLLAALARADAAESALRTTRRHARADVKKAKADGVQLERNRWKTKKSAKRENRLARRFAGQRASERRNKQLKRKSGPGDSSYPSTVEPCATPTPPSHNTSRQASRSRSADRSRSRTHSRSCSRQRRPPSRQHDHCADRNHPLPPPPPPPALPPSDLRHRIDARRTGTTPRLPEDLSSCYAASRASSRASHVSFADEGAPPPSIASPPLIQGRARMNLDAPAFCPRATSMR